MDLALNNLQRLMCHKTKTNNQPICIKMDSALNNLQRLICHETQTTNQLTNQVESYQKLKKMVLAQQSIITYGSRVSGAIQGKE